MSEFTDDDRELVTQTFTLLQQHVKLSDERHGDVRKIVDDHEARIRKNENFRNRLLGWAIGAGALTSGAVESVKSLFHQ